MASKPTRSRSEPPPPITVEDTAAGAPPQPSPSPTLMTEQAKTFSAYEPRPEAQTHDSYTSLRERKTSTWDKKHRRKHSPNIEWHERWTKDSWKSGRVLLIDYVAKEHTSEGKRKIVAQEFQKLDELRKFYRNEALSQQAALRLIHVQNASWATKFLLRKFNIDATDDLIGTSFGRWARYEKPQQRGGKPVLNGKTFRAQRDPWRGISRTAFGCDYLRHYDKVDTKGWDINMKMMELNSYDEQDQPTSLYDVFGQRISVYVQLSDGEPGVPDDPDIRNPYNTEEYQEYHRLKRQYGSIDANGHERYIPQLQTLDNGSTIIVFEHSASQSVQDTLIGAREELEARWRRLTFYLSREDTDNNAKLAIDCMDFILRDIFKALTYAWEKYISLCTTHVNILEEKIYENPADESRAPELWTNSSMWLKVERLMYLHADLVKEMTNYLRDMNGEDPKEDQPWLGNAADEMEKLKNQFQEGVVKPTTNLSDLMYKSVGIRDARHSLQLGLSMWRLSWITFIFLPLTFVSGFFGMNVDTFEGNPSIKWWFIATIPLFTVVLVGWYGVKHSLASQRQDPLRRGVYESLYNELSTNYPAWWTRRGPKDNLLPADKVAAYKWDRLRRWFDPKKTIMADYYNPGDEELGVWSRVKRYLARRWLAELEHAKVIQRPSDAETTSDPDVETGMGAVADLVNSATPVGIADAEPTAASHLRKRSPLDRFRSLSPKRSGEMGRPSSDRASSDGRPGSGVMVEEKGVSEDERSGGEDDDGKETKSFQERLNVPLYPGGAGIVAGGL